ncbi:hypothetical protein LTR08_003922 [Meristemomyces frigidus]|nr:hypothetical protein LTR08_003922 [Meristemomyces frigidus]
MSAVALHRSIVRAAGQLPRATLSPPAKRPLLATPPSPPPPAFATMAAPKLHGRAFYNALGAPQHVLAPMVDQSEFAWRLLTRSFLPADLRTSVLAYSPMLHAKMFADSPKYRAAHFEPLKPPLAMAQPADAAHLGVLGEGDMYLDGNPRMDRPLIVQFCANDAACLLEAAKAVQPYCDAVDLNLGCPQGIARRGHYGAFLQDDWGLIHNMVNTLHRELAIPVTAKMRVLETRERTLAYARMLLDAGASILTVHGRQREQKGHNTGLADWSVLRYLREQLPEETVIFANGNILQHEDLQQCLDETKADGVMTAEGNLYDPSIFATPPPVGEEGREYWRGRDGKGGYRVDAVLRRYLDITHQYVLNQPPPARAPLFLPSDIPAGPPQTETETETKAEPETATHLNSNNKRPLSNAATPPTDPTPPRASKKQKKDSHKTQKRHAGAKHVPVTNPNLVAMQAHCFHILKPLVARHHAVRDALARSRAGDIEAYERVLALTEGAVREGLVGYEALHSSCSGVGFGVGEGGSGCGGGGDGGGGAGVEGRGVVGSGESSDEAVKRCQRPYWVCQPYVRPLPLEALAKGSLQLSKKALRKLEAEGLGVGIELSPAEQKAASTLAGNGEEGNTAAASGEEEAALAAQVGLAPGGKVDTVDAGVRDEITVPAAATRGEREALAAVPREGLVCG